MIKFSFAANINSRLTSLDELELFEKTSTMILTSEMAVEIAVGQSVPGVISLGAIQHRIPVFSKLEQIASAIYLSLFEYEINTSCAIGHLHLFGTDPNMNNLKSVVFQ